MKKLISLPIMLCFLLETGTAKVDAKIGLGLEFHTLPSLLFSIESMPMGFSMPIHISGFMLEPEGSFYTDTEKTIYSFSDTKDVISSRTLSVGFYKTFRAEDMKSSFYAGIRVGKSFSKSEYTAEDNEITLDEDDMTYYAPTIGAEYFISDNLSFGGEAKYDVIEYETEYLDEYYNYESDNESYTMTITEGISSIRFMFRFYF